jgi:hypothetical protein
MQSHQPTQNSALCFTDILALKRVVGCKEEVGYQAQPTSIFCSDDGTESIPDLLDRQFCLL